jgi:hypothetical protein
MMSKLARSVIIVFMARAEEFSNPDGKEKVYGSIP